RDSPAVELRFLDTLRVHPSREEPIPNPDHAQLERFGNGFLKAQGRNRQGTFWSIPRPQLSQRRCALSTSRVPHDLPDERLDDAWDRAERLFEAPRLSGVVGDE